MPESPRFVVLVPVKTLALAKSRLTGLPDERRQDLAAAFAQDTIAAVLDTTLVERVMVLTDDFRFADKLASAGCTVIPDGASDDLNASLRQAAAEAHRRWPRLRPVALAADLPALKAVDLSQALAEVPSGPAYVADHAGSGTTLYTASYAEFAPSFGNDSAAEHARAGATSIDGDLPTLRLDVDDVGDLGRALSLGVGIHTAAVTGRV
ncbi:2-phospho-L-lactate guanylyltransferase [Nocardioides sp. LHG3406-4]|uniref:2-phospho-L-lactate guanylyltransferase n=1 Tax=Nocardioides sp. LHG3406-4 TaxID=2804575 RepID=UPI003CEBAB20